MKPAAFTEAEIMAARQAGASWQRGPARTARVGAAAAGAPVPGRRLPDLAALAGRCWYVGAVELQADYAVHDALLAAGFAPWLVECRVRRRDAVARRVVMSEPEPAFPGYLLLPLDLARDDWRAVEALDGVDRLLRRPGAEWPVPIRGGKVAELRAMVDQAAGVVIVEEGASTRCRWKALIEDKAAERFAKGDAVRVAEGPLMGFRGLYLLRRAADRVRLLLDELHGGRVVDLPEAWVEPA